MKYSNPNKFNGIDDEISSNDSEKADYSGIKADGYQVTYSKWSRIRKENAKDHIDGRPFLLRGELEEQREVFKAAHLLKGLTSCFSD